MTTQITKSRTRAWGPITLGGTETDALLFSNSSYAGGTVSGGSDVVPGMTTAVDIGVEGLRQPILIGQGGFGAVYRAEQPSLGRTVAVKILSAPGMDERTRDRFERECVAIGALSGHPHIVTVFDSGINEWGRPFIVMDFMSRGSIADRVALDGPMQWPEAVDMGVKVGGAVASAHANGILHRDIKPQNVLVSAYGEPKLGDFGISSIGGEQTSSGTVTASLEHAAPELLNGAPASIATDVYALASTIYTMVAGRSPFARNPDEPIQSLITRILTERVPDLRPRGVPGALCDVLERGLSKEPADRYGSSTEFADALRDVQEQQGLVATPLVRTEAVGGYEVLDRFAPRGSGTTAPTRARVRNEYVPPVPPAPAVPVWKRPLFVAAAVMVLLALAATSFALTRPEATPEREPAVAAEETPAEIAADRGEADGRAAKKKDRNDRKRPGKKGSKGTGGFAGGSGSTYVPPSSGSSSSGSGTGTSGAPSGDGDSKGSGGNAAPQKEPEPPPAPDSTLWHAYKDEDHVVGIDPGVRTQYASRGYTIQEIGRVYSGPEEGTRSLPLDGGTGYVFVSGTGETSPQTSRIQLWRMSKGSDFFYTTDQGERSRYLGYGWSAGEFGWVAP